MARRAWRLRSGVVASAALVLSLFASAPTAAQTPVQNATTTASGGGVPGSCTGKFVNPVTDVCWSCLFPLSVGGLHIFPSLAGRPDTGNPALPICLCGSPIPRIGIAMGFWEPVRLADVSVKPWCFVNLGGKRIAPGFDIGYGKARRTPDGPNTGSKWHVHWYMYPLLYWMEVLTDMACLEQASFDIAYVTEIDPLWQDDTLTALINPEVAIFANPIAQAACAADCASATVHLPLDPLFWCAGCQGPMYPMNGNVSAHIGHVQASRLALSRFSYKMHRMGIAWGTMGGEGLCKKYLMPIMKKQQYRFQAVNPSPMVKGRWACPPIGSSDLKPGSGNTYPAVGEDMGYLVWRKRNCCVL
ncbi:TraU family protein [Novosphingobium sp. G106]|uniref:conjugal transfer pilus assembly protein TraU n=1 Tax=Novosphingobium sp. G106 TaxID=2849500 RepID=UPI001C2D948B|nr:TraU family protein [Novosphingobium sp. G106]